MEHLFSPPRHDLLNKDKLPAKLNDPAFKKVLNVLEIINFTDEERMAYEDRLKWLLIEANTLEKYEEKGLKKGREEKEVALKKAEKEREAALKKRNLEIANNMLSKGIDVLTIADIINLSKEEIEKLS